MPTSAPARSRKRRSRKARPPEGGAMDPQANPNPEVREGVEDSECCNEKKGKAKCGACAAGKPCSGRDDSITGAEYLIAADLGIADRPRPYIRARLDAMKPSGMKGQGKKCGASYISASATCHNGQAPQGQGQGGQKLGRGAKIARGVAVGSGVAGMAASVNSLRQVGKGNLKAANRSLAAAGGFMSLQGAALREQGRRSGDKDLQKLGSSNAKAGLAYAGAGLAMSGDAGRAVRGAASALKNRGPKRLPTSALAKPKPSMRTRAGNAAYKAAYGAGRAAGSATRAARGAASGAQSYVQRMKKRRGAYTTTASWAPSTFGSSALRRRDSIWADGFSPESEALMV